MSEAMPELLRHEIESFGKVVEERDHARDIACTLEQELAAANAAADEAEGLLHSIGYQGGWQYLHNWNCDGTVANVLKRHVSLNPSTHFSWWNATKEEADAARFECPYCGALYDSPVICKLNETRYPETVACSRVVSRGQS